MKQADLIVAGEQVVTCAPGSGPRPGGKTLDLGVVENGAVAMKDDRIVAVGKADDIKREWSGDLIELPGTSVVPGLVDAHSHPIFSGSRVHEFILRAQGANYEDIHAAGGGIASTVTATRQTSDGDLKAGTRRTIERMIAHGTTTLEAKSGYGLSTDEEIRHLSILKEVGDELPISLVATCLGAHALPPEFEGQRDDFIRLVTEDLLPAVKAKDLARFVDVFCEQGAFTVDESRRVLEAAKRLGFGLRIHAEEFHYLGGARMAAELGAASADHLQHLPDEDFESIRQGGTIPVMIPGTSFFLDMDVYAPARRLLDAGLPVALGTDFNAGSCMTESMPMAMSLAVIKMKMTPEEALLAATVNSAASLGVADRVGSLEPGKRADLLIIDAQDWRNVIYHFGVNLVRIVVKDGAVVNTILDSPIGAPL